MKQPDTKNISDAAKEAASVAEMQGRVQIFLDCDPEYRQAKITVEGMTRVWNPQDTKTYCSEYTERAIPLTAIYVHEMIHKESGLNVDVAKDKIIKALNNEWDLYVGYHAPGPEIIPLSVDDLNWAARTAHGIHGKRTVSLWRECVQEPDDELYFLWVSADMLERDPPGAVKKVTDLCKLYGDYNYKEVVDKIAKAVREYLIVDDLNPLWSHHCFQHHIQYQYPPKA